jgi:hypothetical protein
MLLLGTIEPNSLLDRAIAITIVLFILSMISERVITLVKLYFTEGKGFLWGTLIRKDEDLSIKGDTPQAEKKREMRILRVNIAFSILVAFIAHANIFKIISADEPYRVIGWVDDVYKNHSWYYNIIREFWGCVLGGFFISLGSKFWHDMLDMLFYAKNLKQKMSDPNTYQMDNTSQLDEWLKASQADITKKVFDENKEKLKAIKGVQSVGMGINNNGDKQIEVGVESVDIKLPNLSYNLPNGKSKEVTIVKTVVGETKTHIALADKISNKITPTAYGSLGLIVKYNNPQLPKKMLLTCYHVVKGTMHHWDRFTFEGEETILDTQSGNLEIGKISFAMKNDTIDAAIVELADQKAIINLPGGITINGFREITYEERYNNIKVKMYGANTKGTAKSGIIRSLYNDVMNMNYGSGLTLPLTNLIAINDDQGKPISAPGDSGSAILDENNKVVGIVVGGNDTVTYAIPIQTIFKQLNIQLS